MLNVFRIYGRAAREASRLAVRAWPLALVLPAYTALLIAVLIFTASWGFLSGIALVVALAFLSSSYLHLLALAVAGSRITVASVKESFGARIWDVVSVMFAFWIVNLVISVVIGGMPKGQIIAVLIGLAMAVFFNAVPELLYQSRVRSFALLGEAVGFISAHGLEWLFPNLLLGALLLWPTGALSAGPLGERVLHLLGLFSREGVMQLILDVPHIYAPVMLALLHWAMIFRGRLFEALVSGRGRQQSVRDVWGRR